MSCSGAALSNTSFTLLALLNHKSCLLKPQALASFLTFSVLPMYANRESKCSFGFYMIVLIGCMKEDTTCSTYRQFRNFYSEIPLADGRGILWVAQSPGVVAKQLPRVPLLLCRADLCKAGGGEQWLALVSEQIWLTSPSSSFPSFTLLQVPLFYLSQLLVAIQKYSGHAQMLLGGTLRAPGWSCAALCWCGGLSSPC